MPAIAFIKMAASLSAFYSDRKMEDITNRHKKHKLDSKRTCYPIQQRLPSPSSPCCSDSPPLKHHARNKSVLFVLDKNQMYEASPLLTPKDEDDDDDDTNYDLACSAEVNSDVPLADDQQLDANPDYIALTSLLSLLNRTKSAVSSEISSLQLLKTQAETASKLDLVAFYVDLICNRKHLPLQHKVLRAPEVQWERYHPEMASVSLADTTNDCNEKRLFKTLSMFQPSP